MKPRSACTKIANRLSSSFGNTSAKPRALPRFWLISIRALSFASVFTSSRKPVEPEETISFDMIVELVGRLDRHRPSAHRRPSRGACRRR